MTQFHFTVRVNDVRSDSTAEQAREFLEDVLRGRTTRATFAEIVECEHPDDPDPIGPRAKAKKKAPKDDTGENDDMLQVG